MAFIPNLLTLLNLCFGILGIVLATREEMVGSAYCIFIAAGLDFLDGLAARLLKANSELGKQLDSLADMVTFGVLPGIMVFQFIAINRGIYFDFTSHWSVADFLHCSVAMLIPVAAAIRLGRFNLASGPGHYFQGVPTPAVALLVASFPLILEEQFMLNFYDPHRGLIFGTIADYQRWEWLQFTTARMLFSASFFQLLSIALAVLMLARVPMISLKFRGFSWAANKWIYGFLIWLVIVWVIFIIPYLFWIPLDYEFVDFIAIPIAWLGYVVLSIVYATFGNPNKRVIEVQ